MNINLLHTIFAHCLGLVVDPVFKAIARSKFVDGLRTGVLPEAAADALVGPSLQRPRYDGFRGFRKLLRFAKWNTL